MTDGSDALADELDSVYSRLVRKRRARPKQDADPLAERDWITIDLHMHTDWSHDCSIPAAELVDHAEGSGSAGSRSPTTTSSAARSKPCRSLRIETSS